MLLSLCENFFSLNVDPYCYPEIHCVRRLEVNVITAETTRYTLCASADL
jgi:hypothetical protein